MWNVVLTLGSWGLYYGGLLFCVGWILMERRFFAGHDPECLDRKSCDVTGSVTGGWRPLDYLAAAIAPRRTA